MAAERTRIKNRPEVMIQVEGIVPGGLVINAEIPEFLAQQLVNWVEKKKGGRPYPSKNDPMYEESRRTWEIEGDSEGFGINYNPVFDGQSPSVVPRKRRYGLHCSGKIARELDEAGFIKVTTESGQ